MARPRNQGARRQALIEATYSAGHKHGLRSLSLTDVAEQAGLSRGTVLYYYDDLDASAGGGTRGRGLSGSATNVTGAGRGDPMTPRINSGPRSPAGLPSGPDDALMRLSV